MANDDFATEEQINDLVSAIAEAIPAEYVVDVRDHATPQDAVDSVEAAGGGIVQFPSGPTPVVGDLVVSTSDVFLRGVGSDTILQFDGGGVLFDGTPGHLLRVGIESMAIERITNAAGPAIRIQGAGSGTGVARWVLNDVHVKESNGVGLLIDGSYGGSIHGCFFQQCTIGVQIAKDTATSTIGGNAISFHGGEIQGCAKAVDIDTGRSVSFHGTLIQGNTVGVELTACSGTSFVGCYFEGNSSTDLVVGASTPVSLGTTVLGGYFTDAAGANDHAIELAYSLGTDIRGVAFAGYTDSAVTVTGGNSVVTGFVESCYSTSTVLDSGSNTAVNSPTYGALGVQAPTAGGESLGVKVDGDSHNRAAIVPSSAGGSLRFGSGSSGVDIELRRDGSTRARLLAGLRIDGVLDAASQNFSVASDGTLPDTNLGAISNVDETTAAPASGDVLTHNGTDWAPDGTFMNLGKVFSSIDLDDLGGPMLEFQLVDSDGSTPNAIEFRFDGVLTSWFNEFGEFRSASSSDDRVAMRAHGHSDTQSQYIFEVELERNGDSIFQVGPDDVVTHVPFRLNNDNFVVETDGTLPETMVQDLGDVAVGTVADGDVLISDSGNWVNTSLSTVVSDLEDAIDAVKAASWTYVDARADATLPRPTGWAGVIWLCDATGNPTNAATPDIIIREDEAV